MKAFIQQLIVITAAAFMGSAFANEHADEKKPAEGHGEEKKAEGHGESGGHDAPPPAPVGPSRNYNPGPVEPFPKEISGTNLQSGKTQTIVPKKGRVTVVFFIASWCEPCQQLMPKIKITAAKYSNIYTDVIYVFAHDTKEDAAGFAKEHKLTGTMLLANHEILKSFKNPPLPAVYVGDRYTYLSNRYLKMNTADIESLDKYLAKLTAL